MLRDSIGRFARSGFGRKAGAAIIIVGCAAIAVHLFTATYKFSYDNGIYGIVAKNTLRAMSEDSEKARAYDTIPDNYYSAPAAYSYPDMD